MSTFSGGPDLDSLLERELQNRVGDLAGPSAAPAQSAYHVLATGGKSMSLFSSLTAAASTKAAAGLAAAALVTGGGAVAATASTGSADPAVWGRTVTAAVATCKAGLAPGEHGIGQCVSAVAREHGEQQRAAHAASEARQSPPAGRPSDPGKPSDVPGGKPSDTPGGRPSSVPPAGGHSPAPTHR